VLTCLRYAAALSPTFALSQWHQRCRGRSPVEVTDPDDGFVLTVDDAVTLTDPPLPGDAPCLRGSAVELVEALSNAPTAAGLDAGRVAASSWSAWPRCSTSEVETRVGLTPLSA